MRRKSPLLLTAAVALCVAPVAAHADYFFRARPTAIELPPESRPSLELSAATLPAARISDPFSFDFASVLASANLKDPVSWTVQGALPSGFAFQNGVLSGTPSSVSGPHALKVTATSGALSSSKDFTLTVKAASVDARLVVAGSDHVCALTNAGAVKCWGAHRVSSLDSGSSTKPRTIPGLESDVVQLTAGQNHTCALKSNGRAFCFGSVGWGALGARSGGAVSEVVSPEPIAAINASGQGTCVISPSGNAQCRGYNDYGALGRGTRDNASHPEFAPLTLVSGGVTSVFMNDFGGCASTKGGAVQCWGDYGSNSTTSAGTVPNFASGAVSIQAMGTSGICGIDTAGGVKCFEGYSSLMGRGLTSAARARSAEHVIGFSSNARAYSMGSNLGCAVSSTGSVSCWGHNNNGALGNGSSNSGLHAYPQDVSLPKPAVSVAVGFNFGCAAFHDGAVSCWGEGTDGQLGNLARNNSLYPVSVVP